MPVTDSRTAIVLFNLGGPDSPAAIQPFLRNLFSDPAILRLPTIFRRPLAALIARRRAPKAAKIYSHLGGRSPILPNTEAQARALEAQLGKGFRCFIAMRYWHPFSAETIRQLTDYQPTRLVLLPLYPQFSTTTTTSSLEDFWREVQAEDGSLHARWEEIRPRSICCYPTAPGFIEGLAENIRPHLNEARKHGTPRLLLSAHGLPEKVISAGDPYQWQCEQTARAVVEKLASPDLDWNNCYQSRVGPLKWIGPATEDEIRRAGAECRPVVVAPIAFVSEHSETLVELDIEYRKLAESSGVPFYSRVPTASTHPAFMRALADLVRQALDCPAALCSHAGGRVCPQEFRGCPHV